MSKIDKETIFDSFWQPFSDGLDSLEKSESASVDYEPADEKHYISFPNGQSFTVEVIVKEVTV